MLVVATEVGLREGCIVTFRGADDHGLPVSFATDLRASEPIVAALQAGEQPVCLVAPWQLLGSR